MPVLCIVAKALAPYRVRFYSEVAKSLTTQGWKVTLVVAMAGAKDHPWANPGSDNAYLDISCAYGAGEGDSCIYGKGKRLARFFGLKSLELPNVGLIRLINDLDADVIWTHEYSPFCLAAAIWASLRDRHCILSSDLGSNPPSHACTPLQLTFHRMMSSLYEGVIANSPEATRRTHPAGAPVVFAPHAIDTDLYCPSFGDSRNQDTFQFLFAGGIRKEKGIESLVAACDILASEGHRFTLRAVGTGPLSEWLEEAGRSRSWLSIGGFIEGAELREEYRESDAYVLPTEGDTYAVTVHEAAASGLPLIVGETAGAVETLVEEGISGFAIDPHNVPELAARMRELLENRQRAKAMGMHARKLAEALDVKLLGRRTADFILKISRGQIESECREVQQHCEHDKGDGVTPVDGISQFALPVNPSTVPAKLSVAAVFVTMNRSATALTCLEHLAAQTRRPDLVFVLDNASSDDTAEKLAEFAARGTGLNLRIHRLDENLGNAGGMEIGLSEAFAVGVDAVWILDDDSWPAPGALEQLLSPELPGNAVRSSRVIDLATGELSWPLQVPSGDGWKMVDGGKLLMDEPVLEVRRSWLGALIPRHVYESVRPVEGRLFLRGEDEDYPRRIERAGFPVYMIRDSVLHHPPSGPMNRWQVCGREVMLETGLQGDKLYYRIRNMLWIKKSEAGFLSALFLGGGYLYLLCRWHRPFWPALRVAAEAAVDACAGRLGQRKKA